MRRSVRRGLLGLAWVGFVAVVAVGSAGLVAGIDHVPGTVARIELTWGADKAADAGLDRAVADLTALGEQVDRLGTLGRGALAATVARDTTVLTTTIDDGAAVARDIESRSAVLRSNVEAVAGTGDDETTRLSWDPLARRDSIGRALTATTGLSTQWARLTDGALSASHLAGLLLDHDTTMAQAAGEGVENSYANALTTIARAVALLDRAQTLRDRLANAANVEVLDQWLSRNRKYDAALAALYGALQSAGGEVTDAVRAAYAAEQAAREQLPPDTRGLIVIMAEIGQGGLNQAVIAIELARTRLDDAIAAIKDGSDSTAP